MTTLAPSEAPSGLAAIAAARIEAAFRAAARPDLAPAAAHYMRDQFPFLGIKTPERVKAQREALRGLPPLDEPAIAELARRLFALPEREFQYAAADIVRAGIRRCGPGFLAVLEELIQSKSWWDTVDSLAKPVRDLVLAYPELLPEMDRWLNGEDHWLARVAILHQLGLRGRTDESRLFRYCLARAHEGDFFLRKAIGWALRDYSWFAPAAVEAFVREHEAELSPLTRREALLAISGARKTRPGQRA